MKATAKKELTPAQLKLLDKFKGNIGKRADFIDLNVRGEKPRKIAEIAAVLKLIGTGDSFKIPIVEFERAYGPGKKGRTYVKGWLKQFGIVNPRCEAAEDIIHIWMRGKVQEAS